MAEAARVSEYRNLVGSQASHRGQPFTACGND